MLTRSDIHVLCCIFGSRSRGEKLILEDRNGSAIKGAWRELSLRESRLTR